MSSPNRKHAAWRRDPGTDMTPMVDVTFLLLIFFMVTASFTLQRAIAMPRQSSQLASLQAVDPLPEVELISLTVDRDGVFYLTTRHWQQELLGKQSLITGLKRAARHTHPDSQLEISVDSEARLQWMVDAIDAGTIAGFSRVAVVQTDDVLVRQR
jgi:biopolymer transport protein ExbD